MNVLDSKRVASIAALVVWLSPWLEKLISESLSLYQVLGFLQATL